MREENQNESTVRKLMERTPGGGIATRARLNTAEPAAVELGLVLAANCPHCGLRVDLMAGSFGPIARAFAKADNLNGMQDMVADCPECAGEILVDLVV